MQKNKPTSYAKLLILGAIGCVFSSGSHALEMGFEGFVSGELRQNTDPINFPDEEIPDGEFGSAVFSVFGEQRSRKVTAGFLGEIETEQNMAGEDDSFNTETRFIGAMDVAITPRTLRWYFGDVLAGVRNADDVRIADDIQEDTRNVFVTGPSYESEIEGVSSTSARLLYVHQTEDDEEIESLYNFSISHQRETTVDSFYGVRFTDIYTQVPDLPEQDGVAPAADNEDFNRVAITAFTTRVRGNTELFGEIGATQYQTEDETVNGATAEISASRLYGRRSTVTAGLSHSLSDETLDTVGALLQGGVDGADVQPEVDGIFTETRFDLTYDFERSSSEFQFTLSAAQLDYQLLTGSTGENIVVDAEDRTVASVNAVYAKYFTPRWRGIFAAAVEREEFINREDATDAMLVTADFVYTLTRNFELQLTFAYDAVTGMNTAGALDNPEPIEIDQTESSAMIGVRWVPPTRATRELTVEIATLLQ